MKTFKQFFEATTPDTPHLIIGKMRVNPQTIPPGHDRARVEFVQDAETNKIHPYTKKGIKVKRGKPKV